MKLLLLSIIGLFFASAQAGITQREPKTEIDIDEDQNKFEARALSSEADIAARKKRLAKEAAKSKKNTSRSSSGGG